MIDLSITIFLLLFSFFFSVRGVGWLFKICVQHPLDFLTVQNKYNMFNYDNNDDDYDDNRIISE